MTKMTFLLRRLAILLVAFVFVAGLSVTAAQAAKHSLGGNGRSQIGNGLPIPIGFSAVPNGKIKAVDGAWVTQTEGPDPKAMIVLGGMFKWGNIGQSANSSRTAPKQNIGVWNSNPAVFQVATALAISGGGIAPPAGHTSFHAQGRTGAATVSFCPGQTVPDITPGVGNPMCLSPAVGTPIDGLMRYSKTTNQFGGPGQSMVAGRADVALVAGGVPPGVVTAIFAWANPAGSGAQGAPFGWSNMTPGVAPGFASGLGVFVANGLGSLTATVVAGIGSGLPNAATSFGGPWTTGMLTISVPVASPPELFTLTGNDGRVNGVGTISMVSGSVSNRGLSGPNANRGWTKYVVGGKIVPNAPSMSSHGLAAVFGLMALAGGYVLRRRRMHS